MNLSSPKEIQKRCLKGFELLMQVQNHRSVLSFPVANTEYFIAFKYILFEDMMGFPAWFFFFKLRHFLWAVLLLLRRDGEEIPPFCVVWWLVLFLANSMPFKMSYWSILQRCLSWDSFLNEGNDWNPASVCSLLLVKPWINLMDHWSVEICIGLHSCISLSYILCWDVDLKLAHFFFLQCHEFTFQLAFF